MTQPGLVTSDAVLRLPVDNWMAETTPNMMSSLDVTNFDAVPFPCQSWLPGLAIIVHEKPGLCSKVSIETPCRLSQHQKCKVGHWTGTCVLGDTSRKIWEVENQSFQMMTKEHLKRGYKSLGLKGIDCVCQYGIPGMAQNHLGQYIESPSYWKCIEDPSNSLKRVPSRRKRVPAVARVENVTVCWMPKIGWKCPECGGRVPAVHVKCRSWGSTNKYAVLKTGPIVENASQLSSKEELGIKNWFCCWNNVETSFWKCISESAAVARGHG